VNLGIIPKAGPRSNKNVETIQEVACIDKISRVTNGVEEIKLSYVVNNGLVGNDGCDCGAGVDAEGDASGSEDSVAIELTMVLKKWQLEEKTLTLQ
jgi:hypothetical protein